MADKGNAAEPNSDFQPIVVTNWAQVSKHLNALWNAHNEHCRATNDLAILCSDPPDTCGSFWEKPTKKSKKGR